MTDDTAEENQPHVRVTLDRIYERQLLQDEKLAPIPTIANDLTQLKDWRRRVDEGHTRLDDRMGVVEGRLNEARDERHTITKDVREVRDRKTVAPMTLWLVVAGFLTLVIGAAGVIVSALN